MFWPCHRRLRVLAGSSSSCPFVIYKCPQDYPIYVSFALLLSLSLLLCVLNSRLAVLLVCSWVRHVNQVKTMQLTVNCASVEFRSGHNDTFRTLEHSLLHYWLLSNSFTGHTFSCLTRLALPFLWPCPFAYPWLTNDKQPASQPGSSTLPIPAASCLQVLLPFCQRLLLIVIGQLNQLPLRLPARLQLHFAAPFQFQFLGFNGVCLIAVW